MAREDMGGDVDEEGGSRFSMEGGGEKVGGGAVDRGSGK